MPTAREVVSNRALSGAELQQILIEDFRKLIENDGLLSHHLAFGRVAYTITLHKHLSNPLHPDDSSFISSKPVGRNVVAEHPALAALEAPPLKDASADAVATGDKLTRVIDSPNAERIRHGMPVPVMSRQQDGSTVRNDVTYPRDDSAGDGNVRIEPDDFAARAAMGQPAAEAAPRPADNPELDVLGKCGCTRRLVAASGLCTKHNVEWRDASLPDPEPSAEAASPTWEPTHDDKKARFYGGAEDLPV